MNKVCLDSFYINIKTPLFYPNLNTPAKTLRPGIKYMLLSTFSFAFMNLFIKKISTIPPMEVVFFRCAVSMLLCLLVIYRQKLNWKGSHRGLLLARGIFGTISLYAFFLTLQNMPLGTAVTIQYLSPVFTTIIAIFLLGEAVKPLQWLFFAISFSGVLVIKGFDNRISITMLLIGIGSAIASGFAYNMVRSLKQKEPAMVIVLHFQFVGIVVGLLFSIFNWKMPQGMDWVYLGLTGISTQAGQVYLTKALQTEKIADATIMNYLGIIYALILGFLFFSEQYGIIALAGIALVIGGVALNFIYQKLNNRVVVEEELTTIEE
ncbi:MAG TPA: DMT family transporter [Chitinophagales bacterium]|nr:DMT family transporter [Chitinophagales bacterium]